MVYVKCFCMLVFAGVVLLNNVQKVSAISCYDCNSAFDPRCGNPFDPYTLGVVNCSFRGELEHLPGVPPALCRKTVQKVYGAERIIRGCGYIKDEDRDNKQCARRAGTHDVFSSYCSCTTDLCNSGNTMQLTVMLTVTCAIVAGFSILY